MFQSHRSIATVNNKSSIHELNNSNFKSLTKSRRRSEAPAPCVELAANFHCFESSDFVNRERYDKQLLGWLKHQLDVLEVDSIFYTPYILSLLNNSHITANDSSRHIEENSIKHSSSPKSPNQVKDLSFFDFCNSRSKLPITSKSVNNHQRPASTTKFMHKRYLEAPKQFREPLDIGGPCDVSGQLFTCLKDATTQDSSTIEKFIDELLDRFEQLSPGVTSHQRDLLMLTTDMDHKRRAPQGNNNGLFQSDFNKPTPPHKYELNNSTRSSTTNSEESWHSRHSSPRNFRTINNTTTNNKQDEFVEQKQPVKNDAHRYFNAFPALSDDGFKPLPNKTQAKPEFTQRTQNSRLSNQWNGQKIIKTASDVNSVSFGVEKNNDSAFTTLPSKPASSLAGKQRILVAPPSNKEESSKKSNNMVTLKKVSGSGLSKKGSTSNSPARNIDPNTVTNVKNLLEHSSKKKTITKDDEKILSVMPNFMNPLKKNSGDSSVEGPSVRISETRAPAPVRLNSLDTSTLSNNGENDQQQRDINQKQREFFDKIIKRSNSFGTKEIKKYGFSDETRKKTSQRTADSIQGDWRAQKTVQPKEKNPLSATNALVGIMPSYLKSVATADAAKVQKIEAKSEEKTSKVVQSEEKRDTSGARSFLFMNSEEITKFWNKGSTLNLVPMLHTNSFNGEQDAAFREYLELEKLLKESILELKNFKKNASQDIKQNEDSDQEDKLNSLLEEMDKFSMKNVDSFVKCLTKKSVKNRDCSVPFSKRKKYANGGADSFGRFPLSHEEIEQQHELLKNTCNYDVFDVPETSSIEDLRIAFMLERNQERFHDHQMHPDTIDDNGHQDMYDDGGQYVDDEEEDDEADFYAKDYENFLAENERANVDNTNSMGIGFSEFITGNRFIDNTIDSLHKQNQKPCKYLLEGFCARSDCKFSHNFSTIVCKYWLDGFCVKEEECPFKHSLDNQTSMNRFSNRNINVQQSYELDIDGDFPALAKDSAGHSQASSDVFMNSYCGNVSSMNGGGAHKNMNSSSTPPTAADEWPTLDLNGVGGGAVGRYPSGSASSLSSNLIQMESMGINFKVAKNKKNRKEKSKFKPMN